MKLALITDPKGFPVVRQMEFSYHLVLAQYVRSDHKYADFYEERHERGDFIMLDNGAAESVTLQLHELMSAATIIKPDEIILPDVLGDREATVKASLSDDVQFAIPAKKRAICPQGQSIEEWFQCLRQLRDGLQGEFATICVPKHLERFEGGRAKVMQMLVNTFWHETFNIHLLGIWDAPYKELRPLKPYTQVIRGIDTALPFALAQNKLLLDKQLDEHISHKWGSKLDRTLALKNCETLWEWVWSYQ